ncbi:MAG: hypothetical protein ACFFAS_00130 [Promethearchaeota archaeon]
MIKRKVILLAFLPISLFFLTFVNTFSIASGAINDIPLVLDMDNIEYEEYSILQGSVEDNSSIEVQLFQSGWNVTKIDLNITNIKLFKEVKTIENQAKKPEGILYENPSQRYNGALNVQLRLSQRTEILGIYLYGHTLLSTENITFQVRDYDTSTFKPYGTTHREKNLNMSSDLGWYLQDFSSDPLILDEGNYSLVINGTERNYENFDYVLYWYHNNYFPPLTPGLHLGVFNKSSVWTVEENKTFMYKLVQRYNKTYNPTDINMTATINNSNHSINDNGLGNGSLSVSTNFQVQQKVVKINISFLDSIILNYTLHYKITFMKKRVLKCQQIIRDGIDVVWEGNFLLNRTNFHSLKISLDFSPYDWYNISILRNGTNITPLIDINEINETITIYNESLLDLTFWEIFAYSSQINDVLLDYPPSLDTINAGQDLEFSVDAPQGNITIIVLNSNGYERYRVTIEHNTIDPYEFNYQIPSNSYGGIWEVLIFWNNATHSSALSKTFTVIAKEEPFTIDPLIVIGSIAAIISGVVIAISGYQGYRLIKRRYDEKKKNILNMFDDILNIKYLIVSDKKSGLNLYEKKVVEGKQDAMLITGYLDAISKFEIAFTDSDTLSQSIKLEYKDSKILMSDFKGFRITLIMKKNPSNYILNSIKDLSYEINQNYGKQFKNFNGTTAPFKGLDALIEKHLRLSLIYPFIISEIKSDDLGIFEKPIVNRARELLQTMDHFYIVHLIPENMWNYRNLSTVIKLIEKKVFISDKASDISK